MDAHDINIFEGWSQNLGLDNLDVAVEGGEDLGMIAIAAIAILAGLFFI